ncbi:unnamed protein product [Paramecium octaurelia]|uniref:Large ribosomal subunit protein bL28m n=1 Tax=Paramecium octaurelia TaxID=43137 RepID=A0A8S1SVS9_PAROT|nr:unnamed protein product [Paramecium octaurelia]
MNVLLKGMKQLCHRPTFNYWLSAHPTTKSISQLSPRQLLDTALIKRICQKQIPKHTIMSQFCLWHGKQPKSGNQTCFSEKKTRRSWMPNVQKQTYESLILGRRIHVKVTAKTMKCIRKAGSFDNYILLTKPQDLDSIYGEYLRKLMLTKINDPSFEIPHVLKARPHKFSRRAQRFSRRPAVVWHPPEIRHKDLTFLKIRTPNEMNPEELRKLREYDSLKDKFEDTNDVMHPVLNEKFFQDEKEWPEFAKVEGEKALAEFLKKKDKEKIRLTLKAVEEGQRDVDKALGNI